MVWPGSALRRSCFMCSRQSPGSAKLPLSCLARQPSQADRTHHATAIIDLPHAVDAAGNNHAPAMLARDVPNLRNFFGRFAPEILATHYGGEIWAADTAGVLTTSIALTGRYVPEEKAVDLEGVVR